MRYFPALLPVCEDEDPVEALERGDVPRLSELRLHNGTVYRWIDSGRRRTRATPPARREQGVARRADGGRHPRQRRVLLRAGGGVRGRRAPDHQMSFSAAEENFHACARGGIEARRVLARRRCLQPSSCCAGCCCWPQRASSGTRSTSATAIACSIIERRCVNGQNGASWQSATFHHLYGDRRMDRGDALREMTVRYREHMHSNEPVHSWPLP